MDGQNNLSGTIDKDSVLIKSKSPYIIETGLSVSAGVNLTIEPGVTIKLGNLAKISMYGNLYAMGNETDSIFFIANDPTKPWGIINSNNANIIFKYTKIAKAIRFISATGGDSLIISHCNIESTATGNGEDCIAAHDTKKVIIEDITLLGTGGKIANGSKNDAIDLDNIDSCIIRNSIVSHFSDDAIDIGTQTKYTSIYNNVTSFSNYGISIGEETLGYLSRNISHDNDGGIQIHSGANVTCENLTIYHNTYGLECYHSEEGESKQTGGDVTFVNTIFNSNASDIRKQSSSTINISYSISDISLLSGNNNAQGNALLINPSGNNFELQSNSPCINAGSPDSPKDINGNLIDIGAIEFYGIQDEIKNVNLNSVKIYPTKVFNKLFIENTDIKNQKLLILIFSIEGKLQFSGIINNNHSEINLAELKSGHYIVKIMDNNKFYTVSIIK